MTLERPFIDDVCKIGHGAACCRYLVVDADMTESGTIKGFQCAKLDYVLGNTIDMRVAAETMTARAINCDGLPRDQ